MQELIGSTRKMESWVWIRSIGKCSTAVWIKEVCTDIDTGRWVRYDGFELLISQWRKSSYQLRVRMGKEVLEDLGVRIRQEMFFLDSKGRNWP